MNRRRRRRTGPALLLDLSRSLSSPVSAPHSSPHSSFFSPLLPLLLPLAAPLLLSLALLIVLASCGGERAGAPREAQPGSIVVETFPTARSALTPPPEGVTSAVVDATVRPARLTVTAWGTPGCMPYPTAVTWRDAWTVQVTTAVRDDPACSTEYLAVSQVVVLPVEHPAQDVRAVEVDGRRVSFGFAGGG